MTIKFKEIFNLIDDIWWWICHWKVIYPIKITGQSPKVAWKLAKMRRFMLNKRKNNE